MSRPVFELDCGTVVLDSKTVLREVDFRLDQAEFVALVGDNGSGKTTLVRSLLGLAPLTSGALRVFSKPAGRVAERHRIGYVPQRYRASMDLPATAFEVVLSGRAACVGLLRRYGGRDRELADRALATVGLADLRMALVGSLSGGQQQRVRIARALAADPEALVLDEPASGLDVESEEALAATLANLKSQGRAVLLVAHGLGTIEPLVTRVVALEAGTVVYDGAPLIARADRRHLHVLEPRGAASHHGHHHPPPEAR
ncbi:MAG: metal ABC transporter ATP-binding protein [Actinomycetota bacterium]